jgi:hypothetical protein
MSEDNAQQIMDKYEKWDNRTKRRDFIARMEHKLFTKERRHDRSS